MREPILYDAEKPLAHYERAGTLYGKVKKMLAVGTVMPIIAAVCGLAGTIFDSLSLALFSLFGLTSAVAAVIGCRARRAVLCLISIPLAIIAGIVSGLASGSVFAPIGAATCFISALAQGGAIWAISNFVRLKELPGFPFFDPALDDISFAAKDRRDAVEFIDDSDFDAEKTVYRFDPKELEPSENMAELPTGVSLLKPGDAPTPETVPTPEPALKPELPRETKYEQMMKVKPDNPGNLSDIDLFN